jgi:hypothetical protein
MDVMIKAASCCREWLRQHLPLYGTAVPESPSPLSPPPAATSAPAAAPAPTPAVTGSGNGEANSGAAPAAVEGCANDTGSDSESGYQSFGGTWVDTVANAAATSNQLSPSVLQVASAAAIIFCLTRPRTSFGFRVMP